MTEVVTPSKVLCFEHLLENVGLAALFRQRNTCAFMGIPARKGPNTQDQAGRLIAARRHLLEDTRPACHSPGMAEEAAGKSSNASGLFSRCVHDCWRC